MPKHRFFSANNMRNNRLFLIFTGVLLSSFAYSSETVSVSGMVVDSDGKPVKKAEIELLNTKKKKITMDDYLALSHVHISNRRLGLGHIDMALYRLGVNRRIALRAQHFLVAPFVIEHSDLALTSTQNFLSSNNPVSYTHLTLPTTPYV